MNPNTRRGRKRRAAIRRARALQRGAARVAEVALAATVRRARPVVLKIAAAHGLVVLEIAKRLGASAPNGTSWDEVRECFMRGSLPDGEPDFDGWFKSLGRGVPRTAKLDLIYSVGTALEGIRPDTINRLCSLASENAVRNAVMIDMYGRIDWSVEGCHEAVMKAVDEYTLRVLATLTEEQRAAMGWGP